MNKILCFFYVHPGYIREAGKWRCCRCKAVVGVGV